MPTQNIQLTLPPYNASNWNTPLNENWSIIDAVFGNTVNIPVSAGDKLLTSEELRNMRINISGAIGGSTVNLIFPNGVGGSWIVSNNTVSTGGKIVIRTAGYTVAPIQLPVSGSVFVFSDGNNIYSSVSGTAGAYLPLSGGIIDGDLAVNKSLTVSGVSSFSANTTFGGSAKFKDVEVTGSLNLSLTTIGVAKFTVGNALLSGNQVFGVAGETEFNGLTRVESGDLEVTLGNLTVRNLASNNAIYGKTTIPKGSALTISEGATLTVEDGAQLALSGTFSPTAVSTGDIRSSTSVTVTGPGGVTTGAGGLKCSGPADVSGAAKFSSTVEVSGNVKMTGGVNLGTGASMVDPFITSAGFASLHFVSGNQQRSVVTATTSNQIGFFNENDLSKFARLDISTGKWTASGGVGIGIDGSVARTIASHVPASVYPTDCGQAIDIEDVLIYLLDELMAAKSELAALKAR